MSDKESRKKFTSADLLKGKEDWHHYKFSNEAVLAAVKDFLKAVGYELLPPSYIGFVCPDIHARRKTNSTTYELIGVFRQRMGAEAIDGFAKLAALRAIAGDEPDYALLTPPVNENEILQFLMNDRGRWFFEIKNHGNYMIWHTNPENKSTFCMLGSAKDELFYEYFFSLGGTSSKGSRGGYEGLINIRLLPELMAEEE